MATSARISETITAVTTGGGAFALTGWVGVMDHYGYEFQPWAWAVWAVVDGALVVACLGLTGHLAWLRIAPRFQPKPARIATDFVPISDAAQWVYTHGSEAVRAMFRDHVPGLFSSVVEHGVAYVKTAGVLGHCELWGRWEAGLPLEKIDPMGADPNAYEAMFGTDRKLATDISVERSALSAILAYAEDAAKGQGR